MLPALLGGGRYDVKKSLTTTNPDVEDYYVYYRYAEARGNEIFDLSRDPERTTLTDRDLPTGVHTNVRGIEGAGLAPNQLSG